MKTLITFFALTFVFNTHSGIAQVKDTISVKRGLETSFVYNGKKLSNKSLLTLLQANPAAYTKLKSAQGSYTFANILGFAGGALIGYQLGAAAGGNNANWTVAGVGGGLIALAIPFASSYTKKTRRAVSIYNAELLKSASRPIKLVPGITSNGIGLALLL